MFLRRGVSTLAVALTISATVGVMPAAGEFFTTSFEPQAASLAHHQTVDTTVIRGRKHGSGGSQRPVASGPGKRDGLPTERS